jgi:uncharacterized protein
MNRALLTIALIALLNQTNAIAEANRLNVLQATADRDTTQLAQLLAYGADVDSTDANGNTALMLAAAYDYADVTAILVAAGANVNVAGHIGNTALVYAAQSGAAEVARLLIEAGAHVGTVNDFGNSARGLANGYGHRDIVHLIDSTPTPTAGALALAF